MRDLNMFLIEFEGLNRSPQNFGSALLYLNII